MERNNVFDIIAESAINGNLGLFVGAGFSKAVVGELSLSWKELLTECSNELGIDYNSIEKEGLSYPDLATKIIEKIKENKKYENDSPIKILKNKIANKTIYYPNEKQKNEYGKLLENLFPNWIITTNYDLLLECLLPEIAIPIAPNDILINYKDFIPVYHLHGIRTDPDSIVISQEDYITLFRPNDYRQQKLPLLIKESTTVMIGYGIGDINVLTAIDWSKNLYMNQKKDISGDIIQFLYVTENPQINPYKKNGIFIIEFSSLNDILNEINEYIKKKKDEKLKEENKLKKIEKILNRNKNNTINSFINKKEFRLDFIKFLNIKGQKFISIFLEFFSDSIRKIRENQKIDGNFNAYNQELEILLDILIELPFDKIPPILFGSIESYFSRLAYHIGYKPGESFSACNTWNSRKDDIPEETLNELRNIAKERNSISLLDLLHK